MRTARTIKTLPNSLNNRLNVMNGYGDQAMLAAQYKNISVKATLRCGSIPQFKLRFRKDLEGLHNQMNRSVASKGFPSDAEAGFPTSTRPDENCTKSIHKNGGHKSLDRFPRRATS